MTRTVLSTSEDGCRQPSETDHAGDFEEADDRCSVDLEAAHVSLEMTQRKEDVFGAGHHEDSLDDSDDHKREERTVGQPEVEPRKEANVSENETDTRRTRICVQELNDKEEGATVAEPLLRDHDPDAEPPEVPEQTQEDEEDDGVPYDRGWAWMVCFGCFICFVCLAGYLKSSGMIFVELLRQFNAPASKTALLFALRAGIFSVSGLYVMNVVATRLGARKTVLIGGACMSLSAITSSFASELSVLICLQSLLLGVGMAMLVSPGEVLMGSYFRRRRSLALAIAKCGASVGSIAIPPLLSYLISEYGLRGTLLLYGGICLHTIPAALLLRPTSYFSKRHPRKKRCGATDRQLTDSVILMDETVGERLTNGGLITTHKNGLLNGKGSSSTGDLAGRTCIRQVGTAVSSGSTTELGRLQSPSESAVINLLLQNLKNREPARRHPRREFMFSMSYDPSVRNSDMAVHSDVDHASALATSVPELTLEVQSHSGPEPFRERTSSEPPEEFLRLRSHAEDREAAGSALDMLNDSRLVRYISVQTLDLGSTPALYRCSSEQHGRRTLQHPDTDSEGGSEKTKSRCMAIARFVVTCPKKAVSMLDFSLFRRPVFRLLVCFFMLAPVINCNLDYLPAIAAEKGLTETQASLLLSIIGALDLMCRLASGFIADSGKLRPATLIIITYVTMGVVNQFVRFLTTFPTFVVLAILQGLLGGVGNCLAVVLIIDIVGLENMSKAIGFAQLASGASLAAIYPLLGYIRDSTGSYVMVYHVVGLGILLAAGLLALQGLVKRWEKVPEKEDRRDVDVVVSEPTEDR